MATICTAEELRGMTVNERLWATDQFDEYDAAVASNDAARLREVLERLHIGEANVLAIIEARLGRTSS